MQNVLIYQFKSPISNVDINIHEDYSRYQHSLGNSLNEHEHFMNVEVINLQLQCKI